jgi:hypothetical protein
MHTLGMRRGWVFVCAGIVLGCGGSVAVLPDEGGGMGGQGGTAPGGGGAGGDGSPALTHPPAQTYSDVTCKKDGMRLFVEIWPDAESQCVPTPDVVVGSILVMGIQGWDGTPGAYGVGEETLHGVALAAAVPGPETIEGTITIAPFGATPSVLSWDLSVGSGSTDLALCGHFELFPCAP